MLRDSETDIGGFVGSSDYSNYTGKYGIAVTPLRPAGIVAIDGVQLNVVSEWQYIAQGTNVKVVSARENRIIVRPAIIKTEVE